MHYRALCPRFAHFARCPERASCAASCLEREIDFKEGGFYGREGKLGENEQDLGKRKMFENLPFMGCLQKILLLALRRQILAIVRLRL